MPRGDREGFDALCGGGSDNDEDDFGESANAEDPRSEGD